MSRNGDWHLRLDLWLLLHPMAPSKGVSYWKGVETREVIQEIRAPLHTYRPRYYITVSHQEPIPDLDRHKSEQRLGPRLVLAHKGAPRIFHLPN
jgi:hypothetical protein